MFPRACHLDFDRDSNNAIHPNPGFPPMVTKWSTTMAGRPNDCYHHFSVRASPNQQSDPRVNRSVCSLPGGTDRPMDLTHIAPLMLSTPHGAACLAKVPSDLISLTTLFLLGQSRHWRRWSEGWSLTDPGKILLDFVSVTTVLLQQFRC